MPPTITVAVPPSLRATIATQAASSALTQDVQASTALRITLTTAEQADDAQLMAYLTDPRLESTGGGSPTIHIERELNDRAIALAERLTPLIGRTVAKGRVIQALLWANLAPLAPDVARVALPTAASVDSVTVAVPAALNSALLDAALQRQISREELVDILLTASATVIERDSSILNTLPQDERIQPGDGRSKTTIRVGRAHDTYARRLADQAFNGVKGYAVQALLWYGLDHAEPVTTGIPPDRPVLIDGPLYARVARLALDLKQERGRVVPIREFVQTAVEKELEREERRRARKS